MAQVKPYVHPNAWSAKEITFLRRHYPQFETRWIAEQLGRSVLAVGRKARSLGLVKAAKSIWKGHRGDKNAFRRSQA